MVAQHKPPPNGQPPNSPQLVPGKMQLDFYVPAKLRLRNGIVTTPSGGVVALDADVGMALCQRGLLLTIEQQAANEAAEKAMAKADFAQAKAGLEAREKAQPKQRER